MYMYTFSPSLIYEQSIKWKKTMKWVGIFQVGIFWVGIFRVGVFQGGFWWVAIFQVGIFLEPSKDHIVDELHVSFNIFF